MLFTNDSVKRDMHSIMPLYLEISFANYSIPWGEFPEFVDWVVRERFSGRRVVMNRACIFRSFVCEQIDVLKWFSKVLRISRSLTIVWKNFAISHVTVPIQKFEEFRSRTIWYLEVSFQSSWNESFTCNLIKKRFKIAMNYATVFKNFIRK